MRKHLALVCGLAMLVSCELPAAFGQTQPSSVNIPLTYLFDSQSNAARLSINIGINGGDPRPYLFDTGSSLFNAAFDPKTWGGYSQYTTSVPTSTVTNGNDVKLCYSESGGCRGYVGNILQIPSLSFYDGFVTTTETAPAATLSTNGGPGFQINAAYKYTDPDTNPATHDIFPDYFRHADTKDIPPQEGLFYGVFGSRISVDQLPKDKCPGSPDCYVAGGVLGQVIMPGAARQGFVVAANGQGDPASPSTAPNAAVTIGGRTQNLTSCNPCVTVGLTPELIGQFAPVAMPTATSAPGLVQWVAPTSPEQAPPFPNPYGSGTTPNTSAPTDAMYFTVTVSAGSTTAKAFTLLDTGTKYYSLTRDFSETLNGTISITGLTPDKQPIAGLPTATATLSGKPSYYVDGSGSTNTLGIPFFMQNSVMFDLTDQATGYTPFFVTATNLQTTAGGPLIVTANNVPLGLAGVISGPGGLTIESGGAAQLSATNLYAGETRIGGTPIGTPGTLLISGPGSIAASRGVVNDGVFDISRAWAPVHIRDLTGSGRVNLGSQNLTITNGSGTFAGIIADGGEYPGSGGSVTIAGGTQTFAGVSGYTGGTTVSGGTLNLTGTLIGGMTVAPGGTFNNAGTFGSFGGAGFLNQGITINAGTIATDVLNAGSFQNNGTLTGTFANLGTLSGTGMLTGMLANAGVMAPGMPYGTMTVSGAYSQTPSGTLQVAVSPSGQAGRLNVTGATGTAALAGSVLAQVQAGGSYAPRSTHTILQATGGLSGSFSSVTSSSPFLLPSLSYDTNNVYLTLQIGGFATAALNPSQQSVANVLDATAASATGDYATVLGSLSTLTPAQLQPILTALSGTNYAGFSSAMVQGAQLFMNNFAGQATGGGPSGSARVALAEACEVACEVSDMPRWGAWGGAIGGLGTVGAGTPQGAVTYNAGGFAAGLDRALTETFRAGITVGYSGGTQWVSGFSGQGYSDTVQAGLYGNYADGPFYADGLVGYAYSNNRMTRQILIPGLGTRTAFGQAGANQLFGQFETGYSFDMAPAPMPSSSRSRACRLSPVPRTASPRPERSR